MSRIHRLVKPAVMVIAGISAIATLSGSVPATAHARAAGAQAHARIHGGPAVAHARAIVTLA